MSATLPQKKRKLIEANRERYETLKAAAQGKVPKALPKRTKAKSAIPDSSVIHKETIPGGWYWSTVLKRGEALRLINASGASSLSLLAWNEDDTSERLNYADSIKLQWTTAIQKGRLLLSDMGRVVFSVIEDTSFAHDVLAGGSTAATNLAKYGSGFFRNTRDNFVLAAAKLGLSRRDIHPCITFFAPVGVNAEGAFVWHDNKRKAGDFVDLRAEMNLYVAFSNCPHPLDPLPEYAPQAVEVIKFRTPAPSPDDFPRTATEEAVRAFENTEAFFSA